MIDGRVFVLFGCISYEGRTCLGVYQTEKEAKTEAKNHTLVPDDYDCYVIQEWSIGDPMRLNEYAIDPSDTE